MVDVLKKPHAVSIGGTKYSLDSLQQELEKRGVRYSKEVEKLLLEVTRSPLASRQYILECRTAHDYGYTDERNRPKLQALINKAAKEGLVLCPYEIPVHLMLRRLCPVKGGAACLVVTPPLSVNQRLFLPMLQGVTKLNGAVQGHIRLVTGDPFVAWSLRTVLVFCREL